MNELYQYKLDQNILSDEIYGNCSLLLFERYLYFLNMEDFVNV